MRAWMILSIAVLLAAGRISQGQTPAPLPPLSPAVSDALKELAAGDAATRAEGAADLRSALGQAVRGMMQAGDPEAQARLSDLLTCEQRLCDWARDVLKKPADQQPAALEFGLQPGVLPHVAGLYAQEKAVRAEAVKALRKNPDPRVMELLAKALEDPEPAVYVPALEGVYDRPPMSAVGEALWNRAAGAYFAWRPVAAPVENEVAFFGKPIFPWGIQDETFRLRTQDNALATDVLIHTKPPQIPAKLKPVFEDAVAAYSRNIIPNDKVDRRLSRYLTAVEGRPNEAMRNAIRLAEAYKSVELAPAVYLIATGPAHERFAGLFNTKPCFQSSRTWAIALVVQLTGQKPADWKLFTQPPFEREWLWLMPTEADENAAVAKLREWWGKEHDKYGGGTDTRPVAPAEPPSPVNPQFNVPQGWISISGDG